MSETHTDHFRVAPGHPALPGHFPGNPLVPGVVVLDRVAAALEATGAALAGFAQVKFVAPLKPGVDATVDVDAHGARRRFRVHAGDTTIASGEALAR